MPGDFQLQPEITMNVLSPVLNVGTGTWHIGKIVGHVAKPLTREEIEALCAEVTRLREQEELHTMHLAAISTAAMQNTESTVKHRIGRENPYWTVAYGDMCATVGREMKHREEAKALRQSLELMAKDFEKCHARLHWLHSCSENTVDAEGYEWGIYRVKWENGKAAEVLATLSDFSDLDAEMEREAAAQPSFVPVIPWKDYGNPRQG